MNERQDPQRVKVLLVKQRSHGAFDHPLFSPGGSAVSGAYSSSGVNVARLGYLRMGVAFKKGLRCAGKIYRIYL